MTSMHEVTLCLLLIALTCAASLLARIVRLPLPFLQIAVGVVAALAPFNLQVSLDPDTFLLLFLPLLLFGDGWRLPRRSLSEMRWSVFGHAVGLVILTTVAGGYALHWLIPAMPLSVAFAGRGVGVADRCSGALIDYRECDRSRPNEASSRKRSAAQRCLGARRDAVCDCGDAERGLFVRRCHRHVSFGWARRRCRRLRANFIYSAIHRRLLTRAGDATRPDSACRAAAFCCVWIGRRDRGLRYSRSRCSGHDGEAG